MTAALFPALPSSAARVELQVVPSASYSVTVLSFWRMVCLDFYRRCVSSAVLSSNTVGRLAWRGVAVLEVVEPGRAGRRGGDAGDAVTHTEAEAHSTPRRRRLQAATAPNLYP